MISFLRGAGLSCLLAAVAPAQVESYRFYLNADEFLYGSVFGVSSAPYAFSLTFTFDLTAHPHVAAIPQNAMGTTITTGNWYAFGAASITALSGGFGTRSLLLQDLDQATFSYFDGEEMVDVPSYVFLADTDLTTAPSFVQFRFEFPGGSYLGFGPVDGSDPVSARLDAADISTDASASGSGFSIVRLTAVPEPSTYAAIAGVCALGLAVWRRHLATAAARDRR